MLSDPFTEAYYAAIRAQKFDWLTPDIRVLATHYLDQTIGMGTALRRLSQAEHDAYTATNHTEKQGASHKLNHARARLYAAILATDPNQGNIPCIPPPLTTEEEIAVRARKVHATRLKHRYRVISKQVEIHTQEVDKLRNRLQGARDVYDRAKAIWTVNQRSREKSGQRATDEDKAVELKYAQSKHARRETQAALRATKARLRTAQARLTTIKERIDECNYGA